MGFSAGHRDDKERRTLASRQTVLGSRRTLFKKKEPGGELAQSREVYMSSFDKGLLFSLVALGLSGPALRSPS